MQKIILTTLWLLSPTIFAHDLPNTFETGQPIVANEVNENFSDLQNQINTLKAQLESQNSTETPREFIGLTTQKTNGDAGGRYKINKMCSDQYTGSSMCYDNEVLNVNPDILDDEGWIELTDFDFSVSGHGNGSIGSYRIYKNVDDFQIPAGGSASCQDWTSSNNSSSIVGGLLLDNTR